MKKSLQTNLLGVRSTALYLKMEEFFAQNNVSKIVFGKLLWNNLYLLIL